MFDLCKIGLRHGQSVLELHNNWNTKQAAQYFFCVIWYTCFSNKPRRFVIMRFMDKFKEPMGNAMEDKI